MGIVLLQKKYLIKKQKKIDEIMNFFCVPCVVEGRKSISETNKEMYYEN